MAAKNPGGWRTCSRGHKYRGSPPICYPGSKKRAKAVLRFRTAARASRGGDRCQIAPNLRTLQHELPPIRLKPDLLL
jgi:hypothetical protein